MEGLALNSYSFLSLSILKDNTPTSLFSKIFCGLTFKYALYLRGKYMALKSIFSTAIKWQVIETIR